MINLIRIFVLQTSKNCISENIKSQKRILSLIFYQNKFLIKISNIILSQIKPLMTIMAAFMKELEIL